MADLRLNLKKFKKTKDRELYGYATYENEAIGVSYAVSADRRVYRIYWFAPTKDDKAVRCKSRKSAISTASDERQMEEARVRQARVPP